MYLFFDTETTGKADFHAPHDHEDQPHLVQLGALVTDSAGAEIARMNRVVKPEGWTVPAEAAAVHGFTTERCQAEGLPLAEVLAEFSDLVLPELKMMVAHNHDFDELVMMTACHRAKLRYPLGGLAAFCTMHAMTDVCKLPGRYSYKWPKLTEAYQHCFGRSFEGAHDAFADVLACKDVFFWLKMHGKAG